MKTASRKVISLILLGLLLVSGLGYTIRLYVTSPLHPEVYPLTAGNTTWVVNFNDPTDNNRVLGTTFWKLSYADCASLPHIVSLFPLPGEILEYTFQGKVYIFEFCGYRNGEAPTLQLIAT